MWWPPLRFLCHSPWTPGAAHPTLPPQCRLGVLWMTERAPAECPCLAILICLRIWQSSRLILCKQTMKCGLRPHSLCSKIWERDLIDEEIESLTSAFGDFAKVSCTHRVSIISLICNVAKTSRILERARAPTLSRDDVMP